MSEEKQSAKPLWSFLDGFIAEHLSSFVYRVPGGLLRVDFTRQGNEWLFLAAGGFVSVDLIVAIVKDAAARLEKKDGLRVLR